MNQTLSEFRSEFQETSDKLQFLRTETLKLEQKRSDLKRQRMMDLKAQRDELLAACETVRDDIDGYQNGDWDGSAEAWTALRDCLDDAIARAKEVTP